MKVNWNKNRFLILFAVIFPFSYVNSLLIILLDLNVFQMAITTTICIIAAVAIFCILEKYGFLRDDIKNGSDKF